MEEALKTPKPPEEPPEVTDSSTLGGWVWIALFGLLMLLSLLANVAFIFSVSQSKKKQSTALVYFMHVLLFAINLMEYCILIFDFSRGLEHQYAYGQVACAFYQATAKSLPILQAAIVVIMLFVVHNKFNTWLCSALITTGLLGLFATLAIVTGYFSDIVNVDGKRYCEIEVSGHQQEISIYYLVHCILSYWLPLLVSITPMIKLAKVTNNDKYPEVTVVLATAASFFAFYSLHGCVVLVRHTIDALGITLNMHNSWMIKVAQSLLWLLAYFWHATRPLLAILLDPDLKIGGCCTSQPRAYDLVESNGVPLKVLQVTPAKSQEVSDENEIEKLTSEESHSNIV